MPNDPKLAGDTCIFMEAIPGDGGNQNPNDVWWLSPDISLTGPTSGPETADVGSNKIDIRIHRRAAGTCTFTGDESVTVEVWVANPSLVMSPSLHGSAARVGFIGSPLPPDGGTHLQHFDWSVFATAVTPVPRENPQQPGPKCLVAVCYPDSLTPSDIRFFVPGDQHLAQHNLSIVRTGQAADVKFKVNTFNPTAVPPITSTVKLRAIMDLAPTAFVKKMVLSRVQHLPGFQRLRDTALPLGFGFDLTGLQATGVVDHSHPGIVFPPPQIPSFEANLPLGPTLAQLTFIVHLKGAEHGEACIFHLTQTQKTTVQGGLTLVLLKA